MARIVSFHLRLTEEEREVLRQMAAKARRSDTAMVRQAIVEAARSRGLWPEERQGEEGEAA